MIKVLEPIQLTDTEKLDILQKECLRAEYILGHALFGFDNNPPEWSNHTIVSLAEEAAEIIKKDNERLNKLFKGFDEFCKNS